MVPSLNYSKRVMDMAFNTFISLPNMPRKYYFCLAQLWTQRRSEQQTRLCNYSPNIQLPRSLVLFVLPWHSPPEIFYPALKDVRIWALAFNENRVPQHYLKFQSAFGLFSHLLLLMPLPVELVPPSSFPFFFSIPSSNNHVAYYTDEQGVQIEWQRERKRLFFSGLTLFTASRVKSSRVERKESENIADETPFVFVSMFGPLNSKIAGPPSPTLFSHCSIFFFIPVKLQQPINQKTKCERERERNRESEKWSIVFWSNGLLACPYTYA